MTLLSKLAGLPPPERRLLLAAAVLLPVARFALHTLPFAAVWRAASWLARARTQTPELSAERIAWAVTAVGRHLPGGQHCLAQAVTTFVFLSRHGHTARMRLGVSRTGSHGLEAHAWVERDGTVLLGGPDVSRFAPLPPLDRANR